MEVDTRKGVVELTSVPRAGAPPETAKFFDGLFIVTQSRGITDLRLTELMQPCSSRARASQRRPKKRKLWGDGRGSFRTTGALQRRDGPRHQVARPGLVRRNVDARHARECLRA